MLRPTGHAHGIPYAECEFFATALVKISQTLHPLAVRIPCKLVGAIELRVFATLFAIFATIPRIGVHDGIDTQECRNFVCGGQPLEQFPHEFSVNALVGSGLSLVSHNLNLDVLKIFLAR